MHPFTILQSKIQEVLPPGVHLVSDVFDERNFGSRIAIYEGSRGGFRLVWDARDGWGFLQRRNREEAWFDVEPFVTEGDIEGIPQNFKKLASFEKVMRQLIEEVR